MLKLVKVSNNMHELTIRNTKVWFSYETPIAVQDAIGNLWTRKNRWGRTTGKHINIVKRLYISSTELSEEDFCKKLEEIQFV